MGFRTAVDDFGAGHAGLGLLAAFQPDIAKLDMALIRGIDTDAARQKIVKHTVAMLHDLDVTPLCEGIETVGEMQTLKDWGVNLMQGYLIARPTFEALAELRSEPFSTPPDSSAKTKPALQRQARNLYVMLSAVDDVLAES